MGDDFALTVQRFLSGLEPGEYKTPRAGSRLSDLRQESKTPFLKGFTFNHEAGMVATWLLQSGGAHSEARDIALEWWGPHYRRRGLHGPEAVHSSSHSGHYTWPDLTAYVLALMWGDSELLTAMEEYLGECLNSIRILSYRNPRGELRVVSPCARVHREPKERGDQRNEYNWTMEALLGAFCLEGGRFREAMPGLGRQPLEYALPRWAAEALSLDTPGTKVPATILGLKLLVLAESARRSGEAWAQAVPASLERVRAIQSLPPVAGDLRVARGQWGYIGWFERPGDLSQHVAPWASVIRGEEEYGYPAETPRPAVPGPIRKSITFPLPGR